jgi:hypothetical protein
MSAGSLLLVIERGYRGAVEVQFSDLLYVALGLDSQFGGVDLVLRGSAVGYAVDAGPPPPVCAGGHRIDVPDPRRALRELLASGRRVWVDATDLARAGFGRDRLIDAVVVADTTKLTTEWPNYQGVWFL